MCKSMIMEGFCRRGQTCAYNHKYRFSYDKEEVTSLQEDVRNLNAEIKVMKETINSFISIKLKASDIQKDVIDIKKDNKKLSEENGKSVLQITALEEELLDETDEEVYEEAANDPQKNPEKVLKCEMCENTTTNNITFKKHMNTKHPKVPDSMVIISTQIDDRENSSDNEDDPFISFPTLWVYY